MSDHSGRARAWLQQTYGDLVVLDGSEPLLATARAELYGCRHASAREPMLAATICVPRDGRDPFPVANAEPLDEDANLTQPSGRAWRWRVNARNRVIAADAVVDGRPASACAWRPSDEEPRWWDRMVSGYFPAAEVAACESWSQVRQAVVDGGAGTRGVVWLRRRFRGRTLTGHLLYVHWDEEAGQAVFSDPQTGTPANLDGREVADLVLARFTRPSVPAAGRSALPWEAPAADFSAAVAKARSWLDLTYHGEVVLTAPTPQDETRRGWLFPCTTVSFLETGDWREQMLDAAVLVPKAAAETPFGLPNRNPLNWLDRWDRGGSGLTAPPEPGVAAWYDSLVQRVGELREGQSHAHWADALDEVSRLPVGAPALVWLRRRDFQGRELVGHLLWAVNQGEGVEIIDPSSPEGAPPIDAEAFEVRVFQPSRPSDGTFILAAADQ